MKMKKSILFFLILILSGCQSLQKFPHEYSHPSDADLEQTFNEKKGDFEVLVSLFLENPQNKLEDFTFERLPERKEKAYWKSFKSLGILSIRRDYDNPKIILLVVSSREKALEDNKMEMDIKGYLYSQDKIPKEKITSGETDESSSGLKQIVENWYIFHETRSGKPE